MSGLVLEDFDAIFIVSRFDLRAFQGSEVAGACEAAAIFHPLLPPADHEAQSSKNADFITVSVHGLHRLTPFHTCFRFDFCGISLQQLLRSPSLGRIASARAGRRSSSALRTLRLHNL